MLAVVVASALVYVALRVDVTPPSSAQGDSVDLAREWVSLDPEVAALGADALAADTGVRILHAHASWVAAGGIVHGTAAPPDLARSALVDVVAELRRLPREMLAASDLRTVILVGSIEGDTHADVGLASPGNHAFLVDVHAGHSARQVVEHELFHLFDVLHPSEPAWSALNPPGTAYDPSLAFARDPSGLALDPTLLGFVSRYSMKAAPEDRAEVYSWLLTEPREVRHAASRDRTLTAKLELLEKTVVAAAAPMQRVFDETRR